MIKNVFVPEHIGDYYVFAKRILSFDINRTQVHAAQVYLHGKKIRIEKFLEEKIEQGPPTTYEERTANAIKRVIAQADHFNAVYAALNSSVVIFKELKLPFLEYEKIKMVINFEIEPLLPFPLASAVIDFIITKQNIEEKTSDVLVAAVQNEHLTQYLNIFVQAGVEPEILSVDLFALYGLYKRIPEYTHETGDVALIDFDLHSTRIAYINNNQLKFIRALPKGLATIAKFVGDELHIQSSEAMEQIMRFGLEHHEDPTYNDVITKVMTTFWSEIDFTIRSFAAQVGQESMPSILLLGRGSEIKGLCQFVSTLINKSCSLFAVISLLHDSQVSLAKGAHVPRSHIICLSAAFPSPVTAEFNMRRQEFTAPDGGLFNKQIIVGMSLLGITCAAVLMSTFWRLHVLKSDLRNSSLQAVKALKEQFKPISGVQLKDVLANAKKQLEKDEQAIAFMDPARPTMLNYLLELTKRVDKQATGLSLERIAIEGKTMNIKGKVKGYPELKILDRSLRQSKYFEYDRLDDLDFDLNIRLKQPAEES